MKLHFAQILLASAVSALTVPLTRAAQGLDVVKTVVLPNGQVLDWVRKESQDANFSLPEDHEVGKRSALVEKLASPIPQHLRGPDGTVPILRPGLVPFPDKKPPPPPSSGGRSKDAAAAGLRSRDDDDADDADDDDDHWGEHLYASTSYPIKVRGGGGHISMFKPYVANHYDFSLMQTATVRLEAVTGEWGTVSQSLEAGWMLHPPRGAEPMFFTFFTTNGYNGVADDVGGWNADQRGWVQVDEAVYPGMTFDKYSVIGGEQLDFDVKYHLEDGKWWLRAFGRDIGYYPADLFSVGSDPDETLAAYGDRIDFYGEVYNGAHEATDTDMGSGNFPDAGDNNVGYIRNMVFLDGDGNEQMFSGYEEETDPERYRIKSFWHSDTSWKSYVYIGGPGADGVVGA